MLNNLREIFRMYLFFVITFNNDNAILIYVLQHFYYNVIITILLLQYFDDVDLWLLS